MKKLLFISFLIFGLSRVAYSTVIIQDFTIDPSSLFIEEERKVIFSAQLDSSSQEIPSSLFLLEKEKKGEKIRYQWDLKDDGSQGDLKAGDKIYSRAIQFKERRPLKIQFLVTVPMDIQKAKEGLFSDQEKNGIKRELEIKVRPSFIEIMKEVWEKIKQKLG